MSILDWLLDGDVSIQYQVHRDLLESDDTILQSLQERIETEGFGKKLIEQKQEAGYIGFGVYGPKWISVHYTLFDLYWLNIPRSNKDYKVSAEFLLEKMWFNNGVVRKNRKQDLCVTAMIITMCSYVYIENKKMNEIIDYLIESQYDDGGWNCSMYLGHKHSSLHTTLSVLECFDEYIRSGYSYRVDEIKNAIPKGEEFILRKELYKSEQTKRLINKYFISFPYPFRWKYDIARALEYFIRVNKPYDKRMEDALQIIANSHRNGYFKKFSAYAGKTHFKIENNNKGSRFNTLRGLKIIKRYKKSEFDKILKLY